MPQRRIPIPAYVSLFVGLGAGPASPQEGPDFVRGDLNRNGRPEVSDAVLALRFLFAGVREPVTCEDAADVDDDGRLAVTDPIHLLDGLFRGGPAPPAPFPDCGGDPTADALGCQRYDLCAYGFTIGGHRFTPAGAFFVIDRSGTMQDTGELARAKREVIQALGGLGERAILGIVFVDRSVLKFPADGVPLAATSEGKSVAQAFIQSVPAAAARPASPRDWKLPSTSPSVSTARQDRSSSSATAGGPARVWVLRRSLTSGAPSMTSRRETPAGSASTPSASSTSP